MTFYRFSEWTTWFLASFFYAYQYVLRVIPRVLMPDIMQKFQIDAAIFGQFSGFYYLGYVLMHIPLGILLDRVGPKVILPLCIVLTSLGLLPLIYTDFWLYPGLGRVLIGMGSSGAILGVFKVIRMNFKEDHFTRMLGISVAIGLLGGIYGGWPIHKLREYLGWEQVLFLLIGIGGVLALLFLILIPRLKPEVRSSERTLFSDVKSVFGNKKLLLICLLGGLMVGPLEGFADVWGSAFLVNYYGFTKEAASALPDCIFFGMLIGSPLLSYVADKTKAYYALIILCAFGMAFDFIFLLMGWGTVFTLSLVFWSVGVLCSYQILVIYKATTYVKSNLVGLSTAIANMIIMPFGYVYHTGIGEVMNLFGDERALGDIGDYGKDAFAAAIGLIPLGLCVGGFGFILVVLSERKRTYRTV